MKYSNWIGLIGVGLLVYASYQPWIFIPSKQITMSGMFTEGTNFGRPALINLFFSVVAGVLFLLPYIMAKRINVFFCAINLAWALRNFILLSICQAGECPQKRIGLYLLVISSLIIMAAALFPDIRLRDDR